MSTAARVVHEALDPGSTRAHTHLRAGLGGEKERWSTAARRLSDDCEHIVGACLRERAQQAQEANMPLRCAGNMLLAAGVVSYLGPYTQPFRQRCLQAWADLLRAKGIQSCVSAGDDASGGKADSGAADGEAQSEAAQTQQQQPQHFQLHRVLGDPVAIRQWNIQKLPKGRSACPPLCLRFSVCGPPPPPPPSPRTTRPWPQTSSRWTTR